MHMITRRELVAAGAAVAGGLATEGLSTSSATEVVTPMPATTYRTTAVDGLRIFYREAGARDAPVILLLHGFPSSSRMYEPLLARLADRYRLIAPDYPGFGHSDAPSAKDFAYTFDHLAEVIDGFTLALGLSRYVLFMQDY